MQSLLPHVIRTLIAGAIALHLTIAADPGAAIPRAAMPNVAIEILWHNETHRSWIVTATSAGRVKIAYVATWGSDADPMPAINDDLEADIAPAPLGVLQLLVNPGRAGGVRQKITPKTEHFQVAYPAIAYVGDDGDWHINAFANRQRPGGGIGPQADNWWPDSFAISANGHVRVCDESQIPRTVYQGVRLRQHLASDQPDAWHERLTAIRLINSRVK